MASSSKAVLVTSVLALCLLLLGHHLAEADQISTTETNPPNYPNTDCASACAVRCQKASRQNMCHRACGTCCARCKCVPPGTSGNTHVCPCYATMTTHGGRLKCP